MHKYCNNIISLYLPGWHKVLGYLSKYFAWNSVFDILVLHDLCDFAWLQLKTSPLVKNFAASWMPGCAWLYHPGQDSEKIMSSPDKLKKTPSFHNLLNLLYSLINILACPILTLSTLNCSAHRVEIKCARAKTLTYMFLEPVRQN